MSEAPVPEKPTHLYSGVQLQSALEGLAEVYGRKLRGLPHGDGDECKEANERWARAYDIAEAQLMRVLSVEPTLSVGPVPSADAVLSAEEGASAPEPLETEVDSGEVEE